MSITRLHVLIILTNLLTLHLGAQYTVSLLPFKKYSATEGLSSSTTTKIAEDPYGYVWIATHDGLNRFDGKTFIHFTKNSNEAIAGNDVSVISIDTARNYLWAATALGGLDAIDLRTLKVKKRFLFNKQGAVTMNDWVLSMAVAGNNICLGTNNGLFLYNPAQNTVLQKLPVPGISNSGTNFRYDNLVCNGTSHIAALINNTIIAMYNISTGKIISELELTDENTHATLRINDITLLDQNTILASTDAGVRMISLNDSNRTLFISPANDSKYNFATDKPVLRTLRQPNGTVWFATPSGLFRADNITGAVTKIRIFSSKPYSSWAETVNQLFFDSNNNIWLSTSNGFLVSALKPAPFTSFHSLNNERLTIGRCFNITASGSGAQFISTENGLVICDSSFTNGFQADRTVSYYSVMKVLNKDIAFTEAGIKLIEKTSVASPLSVFPEIKQVAGEKIGCWLQVNDQLVLLASYVNKGFWKWDIKSRSIEYFDIDPSNALKTDQINSLYQETDNSILIVCLSKIFRYNPSNNALTEVIIKSKPADCIFYDIIKTPQFFLVGTYGDGILVYDTEFRLVKQIRTQDGLPNNNIYNFYPFNDTTTLVSTNFGAALLHNKHFSIRSLLTSDGLSTNNLEYNYHAGNSTSRILLPSTDGITVVQPAYYSASEQQPKLYFSSVTINMAGKTIDTTDLDISSITIPSNFLRVTAHFSGIQFPDPERLSYRYKIEELGADWIDGGNKNYLELIGISHGTYHLQVQAFNEDGIGSEIKELVITILPKWYQTWWFKTLLFLTVLMLGYSLYRIRINQLKKEEKIRNQLASDLHDDLGSTLNSIKVYSNLALMEKEKPEHLQHIKQGAQDAISGIRDIIWVLDDKKDTLGDMLGRITQFALPLCKGSNIAFTISESAGVKEAKLGKKEKRNLYLIIKESINNSLKYSGCKNISLKVQKNGRAIRFEITDDGGGFDKEKVSGGYGLRNIAARAQAIGYTHTLITAPGKGVRLTLEK